MPVDEARSRWTRSAASRFRCREQDGDLIFAAYSCFNLTENLLAAGDPLAEVQREAEHGLAFARNAQFGQIADVITSQLALVRTLRGIDAEIRLLRR